MNKPILFNTPMTQRTDDGTKTETRRVVKYDFDHLYAAACAHGKWYETFGASLETVPDSLIEWYVREIAKPPCAPGDVLWVREAWRKWTGGYSYKAEAPEWASQWKPSIHMPREAARLFLLVTGVRVERLLEITNDGAHTEGVFSGNAALQKYRESAAYRLLANNLDRARFADLWDTTIKPADLPHYGWDANPWVWVIEFERCEKPAGWPGRVGEGGE